MCADKLDAVLRCASELRLGSENSPACMLLKASAKELWLGPKRKDKTPARVQVAIIWKVSSSNAWGVHRKETCSRGRLKFNGK